MIEKMNSDWRFLNADVCGMWPPSKELLEVLGKDEKGDD